MKHRYQLDVADGYWEVDDYLIRPMGVECFVLEDDGPDNFVIYEPILSIHDFQPKLATIEAFQEMKREALKKDHENWKKIEEEQRNQLNRPPVSDVDCV